ncbi:MAG: aldehyde dehydrogenase, partial [Actinomyces sp.]
MGAAELLVDEAIELVERWLVEADRVQRRAERRVAERLHGLVTDPDGVAFTMRFVDRVVRPESDRVAAHQLHELVAEHRLPAFLGPLDRTLLRTGAGLAPHLPRLVMPLARRRLRALVGHLVVDADDPSLAARLEPLRADGFRLNVNLLGEAVLGEREARRRRDEALRLLAQPDVDYVSVKVSGIVSQLAPWDHEGSIARVSRRLRPLYEAAAATDPPTFVNLDMEEYHDLELTLDVFTRLLDEPALHHLDAGIAIQAYLPDALPALERLVTWATARHERTHGGRRGGRIKIRLVKGANLAMERVEAAMRGWPQAPYDTKADTDANYRRCVDWALTGDHTRAVTIGLASHNLFDVAWARLLSVSRGVDDRIEFEMLQG